MMGLTLGAFAAQRTAPPQAAPWSLSGSFETGEEGWGGNAVHDFSPGWYIDGSSGMYVYSQVGRALPASNGRTVSVGGYHRWANGWGGSWAAFIIIDGVKSQMGAAWTPNSSWGYFSRNFAVPIGAANVSVSIERVSGSDYMMFDLWSLQAS